MSRKGILLVVLCISLFLVGCSTLQSQSRNDGEACMRPYLGVALYPGLFFSEDPERYLTIYPKHSDMLLVHFGDSVPWQMFLECENIDDCDIENPDLLAARSEFQELVKLLGLHAANHEGMVYLSVSPLNNERSGVAHNWDGEANRGFSYSVESFGDTEVRNAYARFVTYLVTRIRPDYLSQGVEVNMYMRHKPEDWKHLISLMKKVYSEQSQRTTVIGPSIQWEFWRRDFKKDAFRDMLKNWGEIGEGFALSTYPNLFNENYYENGYFDFEVYGIGLAPEEPFFISEAGVSDGEQIDFLEGIFALDEKYNLLGVNWFFLEDAHKFFAAQEHQHPLTLFHDSGLYDDSTEHLQQKESALWWLDKFENCEPYEYS